MFTSLDQIAAHVQASLADAAANRRSPMHTPVVGTSDADVRIMVLRAWDAASTTLRLHTDARSDKVAAIGEGARMGLLFYDPAAKIQIRVRGHGRIETDSDAADRAWAESTPFARRCYLATAAPGSVAPAATSGLPPEIEGQQPDEAQLVPARPNFAILLVQAEEIDWLWLSNSGHRRARCAGGEWRWVVP